jgi:hypothetical protein
VTQHERRAGEAPPERDLVAAAARGLLPGCATALAADVELREGPIIAERRLSATPG